MLTRSGTASLALACGALVIAGYASRGAPPKAFQPAAQSAASRDGGCRTEDAGLALPPGFCATVFADNLGHARHLAVAANGTVYVNTWSGRYYRNSAPPSGAFLVALRDRDGDGRAESVERFGQTAEHGNTGGTGIAIYRDGLFAEAADRIVRYQLAKDGVRTGDPSTILTDLQLSGDHPMHPFAIDAKGRMFVNSGSATNVCEERNRQPGSKGTEPCREQELRGGIWLYDANKTGQRFSAAARYATGIRNTGGMSFDSSGRLFAVQHGRDQLWQNWPSLYSKEQGVELPAEELLSPTKGSDFGWPKCYYDPARKSRVLAPEYGGDGGSTIGPCATKGAPVATYPAHWAPNDLLLYTGTAFPKAYRGGAFIAFHGSWNRAPAPQDGYAVAFQPLANGRPSAPWLLFANGFAGQFKEPGRADYRPAGLALGPDGALYIADDVKGRIWRITWRGGRDAPLAPAAVRSTPRFDGGVAATATRPPGFTPAQIDLGKQIYLGQVADGTCAGCHGSDGRGSSAGPSLTGPKWLWGDGSVAALAKTIHDGVSQPKVSNGGMPAKGGVDLSDAQVQAVAAYVWTIGKTAR